MVRNLAGFEPPSRSTAVLSTNRLPRSRPNVSLARALSKLGVTSRTQARELVLAGRVTVNGRTLTNPEVRVHPEGETIAVDVHEPHGANALSIDDSLVYGAPFPRTAKLLAGNGLRVTTVDLSELAKAEGAVTCCSLVFRS